MISIFKDISKKEWIFVLIAGFILVFLTTAPLLYGYIIKPVDKFFPAIHSVAAGDFSVYYSYIGQAKEGSLIFQDLFTSESHSAFIFNPFWLIIGLLAKIFHLSSIAAYQISRIILIFLFVFILYFFISYFFKKEKLRKYCFSFSIIASGLGGYFMPLIRKVFNNQINLKIYPMDLWVSEGYNFLTLYHSPHFIMATSLIISTLFLAYYSFIKNNWLYLLVASFLANFLIFFHPFHLPTILAVLLIYIFVKSFSQWRIRWDYFKKYLAYLFIIIPPVLYHFMILIYNPIASGRAESNLCLTPYWWVVLISYGFLIPFAVWGIFKKRKNKKFIFLTVWLIVQSLLIFAPISFQRRLTQGLQIPLSIIAFVGLLGLYRFLNNKYNIIKIFYAPILFLLLILFFGFSNLYVLAEDFYFYYDPEFREAPEYIYLDKEYKEAFDWIKRKTDKNDIILGDHIPSHFVSGFSLKKSYLSHWVETINFWQKKDKMERFWQEETSNNWRKQFLNNENISYVFFSPFEKRHGNYNPEQSSLFREVFCQGKVKIFQINPELSTGD